MLITYHCFVANFENSFSTVYQVYSFLCFHFYKLFTELCKNSKVVFSDFSMMKNIVAPLAWFSSLPVKFICCESFNLACLLKSIAINV